MRLLLSRFTATATRLVRPAALLGGASLLAAGTAAAQSEPSPSQKIGLGVHAELAKLRPEELAMRKQWEEDEQGWHKLPPRAWPPVQPKGDQLEALKKAARSGEPGAEFDLATCLTFNLLDPADGLKRFRKLAADGNMDALVAVGVVLLEGIGTDLTDDNVAEGVRCIREATAKGHGHATYEMACLYYLGGFPEHVAEDAEKAYTLFAAAAKQQHTSALFMQAELLLSGEGCEVDEPHAVRLLHAAALRGHRMARQYVRDYLDADSVQHARAGTPIERAQRHAARLPSLPAEGSEHFCVFRSDGSKSSMADLLDHASKADVVLLGECHDDPVAHSLEAYVLISLAARRPKALLSLEMFERDVQPIMDEYLNGLIREADLLQDARPWANYHTDYRPLVEFAKECEMPVLAANAPRRYVGAVGRTAGVLRDRAWPDAAYAALPPLPLPPASPAYLRHLRDDPAVVRPDQVGLVPADYEFSPANHNGLPTAQPSEGRCPYIGLAGREGLLEPMRLWDAGMAHTIAQALEQDPERLVVHVCGSFHCESRLGIAEMLEEYRRQQQHRVRQVVVVIFPEADCHSFASRHAGRGDFIILTDASLARSHDYMQKTSD